MESFALFEMRMYEEYFAKDYKQHFILFTEFPLSHQRDLPRIISCKKPKMAENLSQLIATKLPESHETKKAICILRKIRNCEESETRCAISFEHRAAGKNKHMEEVPV